jgi:hypothetical protein
MDDGPVVARVVVVLWLLPVLLLVLPPRAEDAEFVMRQSRRHLFRLLLLQGGDFSQIAAMSDACRDLCVSRVRRLGDLVLSALSQLDCDNANPSKSAGRT